MLGMPPMIDSERASFRVITYMVCMDNDQVLSMLRMRTMAVGGNNSPNPSVIKGKGPKMLGNQDVEVSLVFIRTKCARG